MGEKSNMNGSHLSQSGPTDLNNMLILNNNYIGTSVAQPYGMNCAYDLKEWFDPALDSLYSGFFLIKTSQERAGIVTTDKQAIIEGLTERLQPHRDIIQFFGTFGNLEHDIDTILVLKDNKGDPYNFNRLKTVLSALEDMPEAHQQQGPFSIFPSFRLQTWVEASSLPPGDNLFPRNHQSVHLLIYPDLDRLCAWERPLFVVTLLESINLIFGNISEAEKLKNSIHVPPLAQSLEYYINLVYETFQLLITSRIPEQTRLAEALFKLKYIIKFSSLEFLYSQGKMPTPPYTLSTICKKLSGFSQIPTDLFDSVESHLSAGRLPDKDELTHLFDKIPALLHSMCQAEAS